jgi:50S ribosomal subunit-associated GTPase HflX
MAVVEETLATIEAGALPRIIALNKIDRLDTETVENLRTLAGCSGDRVVAISALLGDHTPELLEAVEEMLFSSRKEEWGD